MRWVIEAGIFTALAASLHVGALTLWDRSPPGAQSAGDGGTAHVSLQAAPDAVAALAARWQAPPDAAPGPEPAAAAPAAVRNTPDMPRQRPPAQPASTAPVSPAAPQEQSWRAPDVSRASAAPRAPEPASARQSPPPDAPDAAPRGAPAQAPGTPPTPDSGADRPPRADTAAPQPRIAVRQADATQTRPRSRSGESAHAPAPERPAAPASSEASPAQTASGTGGGADAGHRADAEAALSDAERSSLIAGWGAEIRARVERHKRYPSALRDSRAEGTAMVRLQIDRSGTLTSLGLVRSSGHAALDEAALQAVRRAARFPSAPERLRRQNFDFELPITFRF